MTLDPSKLISRVEAASGPDRELDCYLQAALEYKQPVRVVGPPAYDPQRYFCNPLPETNWIGYDLLNTTPRYTASLDAAVALVEKVLPQAGGTTTFGPAHMFVAMITDRPGGGEKYLGKAATPALALVSALLKAMQAQGREA